LLIESEPLARTPVPLSFALPLSAESPLALPFQLIVMPLSLAPVNLKREPLIEPVTE
jgi:hypothetical protein